MAVTASSSEYQPGKQGDVVINTDELPAMGAVRAWQRQVYSGLYIRYYALKFSHLLPEHDGIAPDHNIKKTTDNKS